MHTKSIQWCRVKLVIYRRQDFTVMLNPAAA